AARCHSARRPYCRGPAASFAARDRAGPGCNRPTSLSDPISRQLQTVAELRRRDLLSSARCRGAPLLIRATRQTCATPGSLDRRQLPAAARLTRSQNLRSCLLFGWWWFACRLRCAASTAPASAARRGSASQCRECETF